MSGKFVNGAWVESFMPKYTVTAISKWIVSFQNQKKMPTNWLQPSSRLSVGSGRQNNDLLSHGSAGCKATDYRYHGIQAATSGNSRDGPFDALQAFVRVVEAGGFTKAAQTLREAGAAVTQ